MAAGRALANIGLILTFVFPVGTALAQEKALPGQEFVVKRDGIDAATEGLEVIERRLEEEAESAAHIFASRKLERPRLLPREGDLSEDEAGTTLPYELWLEPSLGSAVAGALALYSHDACAAIKAMRDEGRMRVGLDELKGRSRQHTHYSVAHELNHAIQYNSTFTDGCNASGWLKEATANGAGLQSAYVDNGERPLDGEVLTLNTRSFDEAFRPSEDEAGGEDALTRLGYGTGAFFHWVGLRYGGPGYLADLYRRPLPESDDPAEAEIRWIDRGLTEAPRVRTGLEFLFPQFIADYGSWGGTRVKRIIKTTSGKASTVDEESWLEDVFGTSCTDVTIKRSKPFVGVVFQLEPISAACVDVSIDAHFSGIVDLDVFAYSVSGDQKKSLDGLHLAGLFRQKAGGRRETCHEYSKTAKSRTWPVCVIKPFLEKKGEAQELSDASKLTQPRSELSKEARAALSDEVKYVRSWNTVDYIFDGPGDNFVLALSNVAPDPEKTDKETVVLVLGGRATLASTGQDVAPPSFFNATNMPMGALAMAGDALGGESRILSQLGQGTGAAGFETGYNLYGLSQAVNLTKDEMGTLQIPIATSDRQERRDAYQMIMRNLPPFGQAGTAEGILLSAKDDLMAVSRPCESDEEGWFPVEVLETGVEGVRLEFSNSLHGIRMTAPKAGCRFIEEFAAELAIPYGWRVYAGLSPSDVVTPGIHAYVERYLAHLSERGLPSASISPYPGREPELPAAGSDGSGGGGSGGGSAAVQAACDCSCDALADLKEEIEAAGDDQAKMMGLAQCMMACQPQLVTCAMTEWR